EAGDGPLVEDGGLDGRLAACEAAREVGRREPATERFGAEADREVLLCIVRVEQEPGAEAPDVAVRDPRAVVELEHGALVAGGSVRKLPGNPRGAGTARPAGDPAAEVLALPLDGVDLLAGEPRRDPGGLVRPRQPRIVDPGRVDAPPLEPCGEPDTLRLD